MEREAPDAMGRAFRNSGTNVLRKNATEREEKEFRQYGNTSLVPSLYHCEFPARTRS